MVGALEFSKRRWDILPAVLVTLVLASYPILRTIDLSEIQPRYDGVELFAGECAITNGCLGRGLDCKAFDKRFAPIMDIVTVDGFKLALKYVLSLKPNGCVWAAPECKTWVFIGRKGTGRTSSNPYGHSWKKRIKDANTIADHTIALLTVAWLRGNDFFLEQPTSSLMTYVPYFEALREIAMKQSCRTYLGSFGARSAKPVDIYSSTDMVKSLARGIPRNMFKLTAGGGKSGKRWVTGKRMELSKSAAYPLAFGWAVAALYCSLLQRRIVEKLFPMNELFH
jgi:hypothetical protein